MYDLQLSEAARLAFSRQNVQVIMVLKLFFLNKSLWAVFVLTKGVFCKKHITQHRGVQCRAKCKKARCCN